MAMTENWSAAGLQEGRRAGYEAGFAQGREHGYFFGRCEGIMRRLAFKPRTMRDIHVLYITAGIGDPYPALDRAIRDGFSGLVRTVTVLNPSDDAAGWAKVHRPDMVLVLNGVAFPAEQAERLRALGIPTAVWFTDDPYYTDWTAQIAPRYDHVFTLEKSCLSFYRALGCRSVHYLPFAADPRTYRPKPVDSSFRSEICFIGTAFWNRVELIDRIAGYLSRRKTIIAGWWWDRLKNYHLLSDRIRLGEWMSPEMTASYYHGAKIVINLHRRADDRSINFNSSGVAAVSPNPRTFEILGCGTLQLTDAREDLPDWYEPGKEIVTFNSAEELVERIDYYLRHEEERREIALNGLTRTMAEHTYQDRLQKMMDLVLSEQEVSRHE